MLSPALVPSKGDPQTLPPALGLLPWGMQPAQGSGLRSQTLGATQPLSLMLEAGAQEKSQAHRGTKAQPGSRFFPFPGLQWEGMSTAHPLCFGTWQGTKSSPCPRNCWPWEKPAPVLTHKSSPAAPTPADGSSAPAPPSSLPAARHGEGSRRALRPPPPRRTVLPEPGSE